jgi:hypothetical protein
MEMKTLLIIAVLFGYCPDKPADLTCKEQALHNYVEAKYKQEFFAMNEKEMLRLEEDFSDTGVGCIDDCLEVQ